MRIGITGASGLIGSALITHLHDEGHSTVAFVRRAASAGEIEWDPTTGRLDPHDLDQLDAVVHLAAAPIGARRWSDANKALILGSRVAGTTLIAESLARSGGPKVLLSASAIGFYGDRGDTPVDETAEPGEGFASEVVVEWERSTVPAEQAGVRVAHLRTGIVLSRKGGALGKMLPLFRFGLGGRFGNGRQWMSWISLTDELRAITHLLTSELSGPVNLTAPNPCTNRELAATLGRVLHRPAVLPVPKFGPKLLFGGELAESLVFSGQRVLPARLEADGFTFAHPELEPALAAVLSS